MCGIVGYLGSSSAQPVLFDLLKRLEYRGYDSAGIAITNESINVFKTKGSVNDLISVTPALEGCSGIGHTRWATHGKPSSENAHPHCGNTDKIAVVHNGIIENYIEIKDKLINSGHKFRSETDTEVLPHLIEEYYNNDLESTVRHALSMVRGSYALAAISSNDPDKIVVARKDSPLVLGLGKTDFFIASDVSGILKYTKNVIFLNDGELAAISHDGVKITTLGGKTVDKKIETIEWDSESAEKSGYAHFMLKEIFEQPDVIRKTFSGRMSSEGVNLEVAVPDARRIIITACGTSYHAGLFGRYVIERFARIPVNVEIASEFRYINPIVDSSDLVIAITQSGETADTLAAVREVNLEKSQKFSIVNVPGSSITRESNYLFTRAGPEIGVAATKSFTSQLAVLLLLAVQLGRARKEMSTADANDFVYELKQMSGNIQRVLNEADNIKKCALVFADADQFLFMGRGANYPIALEGALKLKEISYIKAEGFPAGELKHGPLALIYDGVPVIAIATEGVTYEKMLGNIKEIKARGANVIGIANESDTEIEKYVDRVLRIPDANPWISPVLSSVVLQLFAYYVADCRGCEIDKPRNLAKSVTVE
ncbi:MAG: Glutamine--fructose-6-phosphate aminotransferase[isomerizing] [Candidatus Argoarchaeum ethanivorans]|uniref:Glutamine--fructose-6-phosphate aminotransferase [isomerizing] n=1 Tax=Candidatus Argoarchaeum ethanivorans TaxID=2608793 RepID=A0A811T361_9EURY|nr:MAG: Glutamine--fructose-6-phosphate aminotransferase[isomerizing] [Candidatus Argoarchaeum ethanivorans]